MGEVGARVKIGLGYGGITCVLQTQFSSFIMCFQSIRHNPFEKNVEEGKGEKTSLPNPNYCFELFSCASIYLNCIDWLL